MRDDGQILRLESGTRLSEGVRFGGTLYLAGQVPDDPTLDMAGQTTQVLASIDRLLALGGSHRSNLLMVQIFLANINDIAVMNQVWDRWIGNATPARATVQAQLANPDWKLEIVVTAAVISAR